MGLRHRQKDLFERRHHVGHLAVVGRQEAGRRERVCNSAAGGRRGAGVVQDGHEDRLQVLEDFLNVVDRVELEAEEDAEIACGNDFGAFAFLYGAFDDVGQSDASVVDKVRNVFLAKRATDRVEGACPSGG